MKHLNDEQLNGQNRVQKSLAPAMLRFPGRIEGELKGTRFFSTTLKRFPSPLVAPPFSCAPL